MFREIKRSENVINRVADGNRKYSNTKPKEEYSLEELFDIVDKEIRESTEKLRLANLRAK